MTCPWKDSAHEFVCDLTAAFLVRRGRVTIEHADAIFLNFCRIRKFRAIVKQPDRWENLVEQLISKGFIQLIHDPGNRGRIVVISEKACLE